ncbi:MAG: hypothetical protein Q4B70_18820, partial [Lachnospiraceae bacterium]|nr:hypothetical protein [Lachnospiraceae bacterium]
DSAPYFFTQRDMCAVCDPHVCKYFSDKTPSPFFIISAREGNTSGQKSVDQIFSLSTGEWKLIGIPHEGSKLHYEAQNTKVQRFLLPDLYSNKVVLQTKRDDCLLKTRFIVTNFDTVKNPVQNLRNLIIIGKNLDILPEQLREVIASLETINSDVWRELTIIIGQPIS